MFLVGVCDLVHGVEWLNVSLPTEETAQVCSNRLAIASNLAVGLVPPDVVQKIGGDVAARSICEPRFVTKGWSDVNEASGVAFVLPHKCKE